jgi:hypothetical protein
MSMQDHLLLVLMKLRLGLLNRDLAFQFNLSDTSVSRIINQWIPNIANCLKGLIIRPENDITYSNIPESFKPNYKKVVSTIDCFEVFIETPHNLTARLIPIKITALSNQCKMLFLFLLNCCRKILISAPVFPAFAFLILKSHLHSLGRTAFCSRM